MSSTPTLPRASAGAKSARAMRTRILLATRTHLFVHGYCSCTMDDIAVELGMSKKTLYRHFPGKEDLVRQVILDFGREVRADADAVLNNSHLTFAEKLRGFVEGMLQRLAHLNPHLLRDLQRFAPELYDLLADIRQKNIPYIFGRLIEEGQLTGMVRDDLNTAFAAEFLLHAMQGLLQSASRGRLPYEPREIFENAMNLFFGGLLTPAGRKDYEKLFAR